MASELTTKIRLVRCPKCKKVLPELPDFNVYKCGGCGATLQAKHRVNIPRNTEPEINTAEAVQVTHTNHVYGEKEEGLSRNKKALPCSEECSSCQNDESDQSNKSGDCEGDQPKGVNLTSEVQNNENSRSSNALDSDNEESQVSDEVFSPTEFFDDKGNRIVSNGNARDGKEVALNEDGDRNGDNENRGCDDDDHGNRDFSHHGFEEFSHNEIERFARYENEESSLEFPPSEFALNENEDSSREFAHNDDEDSSQDFSKVENEDSSREFFHNDHENFSRDFGTTEDDKATEIAHTVNESLSFPKANLELSFNEKSLSLAKVNTDESDSKVRSSNGVKFAVSNHLSVIESLKSPRSALKQPQNVTPRSYEHLRSVEFDQSSELSGNLREASKSSTYYGLNDQFPRRQSHPFEDDRIRTNFSRSEELTRRDQGRHSVSNDRPERQQNGPKEIFHRYPSFQSDLSEDPEQMVKLLRMVLEARNQSRNSGSSYPTSNRVSPRPRYEEDPRYLARYASGSNYGAEHHRQPKKIPFSGDPTGTHRLDPSCSHCFPQEWSRSAQLPRPCRIHPDQYYCNCHHNHNHNNNNTIFAPRERERERFRAKRHYLPVARAAPFVVCYKCSNVLHLPTDFLLFKRRRHNLRCGACSEILEFSLEKGSHLVRFKETVPVPVLVPAPVQVIAEQPRNEVSYDDRDRDRHRVVEDDRDSVSSGPVAPTPLGRAFDKIIFGVLYPVEDESRELVSGPSRGRPPRPDSRAQPEEDSQRSTSPLHRLMGYSSPSQVIYGSRPYVPGANGSSSSRSTRRGKY